MESRVVARALRCRDARAGRRSRLIGHTLGAAGAQELGLVLAVLNAANERQRLPTHLWDGIPDPQLPDINLVGRDERWERGMFVSNSFAFGGSNTAVAIGYA